MKSRKKCLLAAVSGARNNSARNGTARDNSLHLADAVQRGRRTIARIHHRRIEQLSNLKLNHFNQSVQIRPIPAVSS